MEHLIMQGEGNVIQVCNEGNKDNGSGNGHNGIR